MVYMASESIGEILKRLRMSRGLSQRKLAMLSGISREYINQIESGRHTSASMRTAQALADTLGENATIFYDGVSNPRSPSSALSDLEVSIKAYIPVYGEVSAGPGIEPIDYIACTRARPAPDNLRAFRVKGLCLEPDIKDGDTLIVDTDIQPRNGDLVIVLIEGQASVKKYREALPDRVSEKGGPEKWLENNSGKYRPEDVRQIGVVVEFNRKRRGSV
jgi:SOS-response transcriptional repressor LexA